MIVFISGVKILPFYNSIDYFVSFWGTTGNRLNERVDLKKEVDFSYLLFSKE